MIKSILPLIAALAFAGPALAADPDASWRFGGDAYLAGNNVTLSDGPVDDLFAAGNRVVSRTDITGSAHMAGRRVLVDGRVGGNFYGAGSDVELAGPVAGNVTAMGQTVTITEPISGNLRAMGSDIELNSPVAGSAIIGGQTVTIDAAISGDLAVSAESVEWGDSARVLGELHVYSRTPDQVDVPATVAPSDRVFVHETSEFDQATGPAQSTGFFARLWRWLGAVVVVGVVGTLMAAVAPERVARLRAAAIARPVRTGWIGFIGLSALAGSVVVLAMTGIGLLLVPVSIVAAILLGLGGYVLGTYVLGVWATGIAGRGQPATTGDRAIAAFSGAAIAAAVALVPWLGWLAVMALFLVGAGAFLVRVFAPSFYAEETL
jgi:hypothetical protein